MFSKDRCKVTMHGMRRNTIEKPKKMPALFPNPAFRKTYVGPTEKLLMD
jgi:hypothetical protein